MRILALVFGAIGVFAQTPADQYQQDMTNCMLGIQQPSQECITWSSSVFGEAEDATQASAEALCSSTCLPQIKGMYSAMGPCLSAAATKYTNALMASSNLTQAEAELIAGTTASIFSKLPTMLDLMCTKRDGTNDYCLTELSRMGKDLANTTISGNITSLQTVCNHYTNLGCCLNTLDQIMRLFAPEVISSNYTSFISQLGCTGVTVPPPCVTSGQAAAALSATITLISVNFAAVVSPDDKDTVIAAIRADLASCTAGSTATAFTVTECTGNPAKCTVSLRGEDDAATSSLESAFKACLAGSPSFPATTAALADVGQPASGTVSLQPGATVSTVTLGATNTNDARAVAPAFFTTVAVLAWMWA